MFEVEGFHGDFMENRRRNKTIVFEFVCLNDYEKRYVIFYWTNQTQQEKMRLIAHNLLKCNTRELKENEGYPLIIRAESTEIIPMDYNEGKKPRWLYFFFLSASSL